MNRKDVYQNLEIVNGVKNKPSSQNFNLSAIKKQNENKEQTTTSASIPVLKNETESNNTYISTGDIIKDYESIPNYNVLERLFDKSKAEAYEKKASMQKDYVNAKNNQIADFINKNGITDEELIAGRVQAQGYSLGTPAEHNKISQLAKEYGLDVNDVYAYANAKALGKFSDKATEGADKNGLAGFVGARAANAVGGIVGSAAELGNYITGKPIGSDETANIISSLGSNLDAVNKNKINSGVGNFAYDVAASIGDMGTAMALGGQGGSLALMANNAASSSMNEQKDKDTSQNQKMATAVVSGLAEAITEKIPLDNLFKMAKEPAKQTLKSVANNVLKQAGSEATEEAITEVVNTIADNLINKSESNYNQSVLNYIAQGMTEDEAKRQATRDVVSNVGMSALAGAVSGGIMAGGAVGYNALTNNGNTNIKTNADEDWQSLDEETEGIKRTPEKPIQYSENVSTLNNQDSTESLSTPVSEASNNVVDKNNVEEEKAPEKAVKLSGEEVMKRNLEEALSTEESAKKINGFNELNESLKSTVNMYGTPEVKVLFEKLNGLVNKYIETGDTNYMIQAYEIAAEMDREMTGRTYTRKRKGHATTSFPEDAITETLYNKGKEIQNVAKQNAEAQNIPTVTNAEAQTMPNVENLNLENGSFTYGPETTTETKAEEKIPTVNATETKTETKAAETERVPELTVEMPKAETKAETSTETKAETKAETTENKTSKPDIADGEVNASITSRNSYTNSNVFKRYEESAKWLKDEIAQGTYKVDYVSEEKSMYKAAELLDENYQKEYDTIIKDEVLDQYQVDESMMILEDMVDEAMKTKDWSKVREFSKAVNGKIHRMAQGLQALAKHTRSAESAILKTEQIAKKLGKDIEISDEDFENVKKLFDEADTKGEFSKERYKLEQQAYGILAKYLPDATFVDKWNAWRYLAMLGNTRTHIRNVFGNTVFGTVTDIKDQLAGAIESALIKDETKRTKSFGKSSSEMLKAAKADADTVWTLLTEGGSKFDMKSAIESNKRIFKSNILEALRNLNSDALTAEDNYALVRKYKNSLASYLTAHGADASIFNSTNEADVKLLDEARKYAINQAQIATFHEDNAFANWLNSISKNARTSDSVAVKLGGLALESVVPFKKTPANILKQGVVEYNPAQIVKGIYDVAKKGGNPAQAIDEVARGLTGSAVMALGYYLAQRGVLRGTGDDDENSLDKLTGEQDYSVNVNGKSYTIDWLAPTALPLFVGAELEKVMSGEGISLSDAFSTIADPVVEMSMLQGLKNTFDAISNYNSSDNSLGDLAYNIGYGYASQAIPTIAGQVARSVDDTRRSTYTGKSGFDDTVQKSIEKVENKIPFLSKTNEAYVDAWGKTQENTGGSVLGRLAYNMLSPGYYSDTTKSDTENELYRLNSLMNNDSIESVNIIPSTPNKSYEGEKLSPEKYSEYSTVTGQNAEEILTKTINSSYYNSLTDEGKADILNKMLTFSNALSKGEVLDYDVAGSNNYKKPYEVYESKGIDGVMKYYEVQSNKAGQSQADVINAIEKSNVSDADKGYYFKLMKGSDLSKEGQLLEKTNSKYMYDYYKLQSQYGTKEADLIDGVKSSNLPNAEKNEIIRVIEMNRDEVAAALGTTSKTTSNTSKSTSKTTPVTIPTLNMRFMK